MNLYQYFACFIIYSFLGWVYESLFYTVQYKRPVNTGFLHGCICPIYGLACVGNTMLFGNISSVGKIFVMSMLYISLIEYIISYILEKAFRKRWWDYSDWPVNIHGRVSLISSLGFGAMSLVQLKFIQPVISYAIYKTPERVLHAIILVFMVGTAVDIIVTMRKMDDKDNEQLWFVAEEPPAVKAAAEKLSEKIEDISEKYDDVKDYMKGKLKR